MPLTCQPPMSAFVTPVASPPNALSLAEGQVPDEARDQAVGHVETGEAVVTRRVVVVQESLPAGSSVCRPRAAAADLLSVLLPQV